MTTMRIAFPLLALAALLAVVLASGRAEAALTHDPALAWRSLHSEHFTVHFHDGTEALAHRSIAIAEQVHARLADYLRWSPRGRTEIVISDRTDYSNGYASPFPANRITLFLAPPDDVNSLEEHAGWLETLIEHEYLHIVHLDKARGAPRVLRNILGRHSLLFPNALQPTWLIEGLATYVETDRERGVGRGQSSYFDMLIRMEVEAGVKPLRQINQPLASWPVGYAAYLYGVHFHTFVAETRGPEAIPRYVDSYSGQVLDFYRIQSASRRAFGLRMSELWPEYQVWLEQRYRPQLAAVEARGLHEGERLTAHGYFTGPVHAGPDGSVYYLRADGESEPALMVLRPGETRPRRLARARGSTRLHVHPTRGILLAQREVCRNANGYMDLYRVDPAHGHTRRLTRCGRYLFGAWSPDGERIAAVRHQAGRHSLELLDEQGQPLATLWSGEDDVVLSHPDWAPDGRSLVAAVWRRDSGWNLEQFRLDERRWHPLTRDRAVQAHPRFEADGRAIVFSADYGGIYNLHRLVLATGEITALSNVRGGAFHPTPVGDTLYYIGYGPQGFDLYRSQGSAAPAAAPLETRPARNPGHRHSDHPPATPAVRESAYSPWGGLLPRWWFPHLAVEEGRSEIGAMTAGWDALDRHYYVVDAAWDTENDWLVGALDYVYDRWHPILKLHASREGLFTRNGDGEVLRTRHSDVYQAEVILPSLRHDRLLSLHLAARQERQADRWTAEGLAERPAVDDNLLGSALVYDSSRRYPRSVSRSDGRHLMLVAEDSDRLGGDFSGQVYTLDWREYIGLGARHVLALRLAGGWGTDQPRPFHLGGSTGATGRPGLFDSPAGNTPFNRRSYALRGYPPGQLVGRRMALATAEWRFPLRLVERGYMTPPVGLHQLHGTLFAEAGNAWDEGSEPDGYRSGVGAEFNADLVLAYNLGINLRLGYACGLDEGGDDRLYLQLGSSF